MEALVATCADRSEVFGIVILASSWLERSGGYRIFRHNHSRFSRAQTAMLLSSTPPTKQSFLALTCGPWRGLGNLAAVDPLEGSRPAIGSSDLDALKPTRHSLRINSADHERPLGLIMGYHHLSQDEVL